jgi:hypothetical protein
MGSHSSKWLAGTESQSSLKAPRESTIGNKAHRQVVDMEQDFPTFLQLAAIPLRELGHDGLPARIASGCLADYGRRRWLLAVEHSTGNMGNWAIEMCREPDSRTKLYRVGQMNFMARASLRGGQTVPLDMAYAEVPPDLLPRYQVSDEQGRIILDQPRTVLRTELDSRPTENREYGFAGNVQPTNEIHFGRRYLGLAQGCFTGLRYAEEDTDFYLFRLPFEHPGHEYFEGTSGAPICDTDGNVVALVCGPGAAQNTIRGIKIGYFRRALDVELIHKSLR